MQQKILLCSPEFFTVSYSINPWMKGEPVCQKTVMSQWLDLVVAISAAGGKTHLIEPQDGLPDMVFTANAGVVHEGKFVVSNMKHEERKRESAHFKEWFELNGYETLSVSHDLDFEGCGDVIVHKGNMIAGHGYRSDVLAHKEVANLLGLDLIDLELSDPRFYHLDTCFCIVGDNLAIYYPGAFADGEIEKLEGVLDLVPISEKDALLFVCNSLKIHDTLLIPTSQSDVETVLNEKGVKTQHVDVSEFLKSGGSIQCLSLRL
tara:strand:+ start:453 stop:1238 length:786 start_codon:yes stop_codon:yes gene_type:complete